MRIGRILKRKLAGIVVVSMLLSCVGVFATSEKKAYADTTDKTITGLGTRAIGNPDSTNGGGWSYVYYGKYENNPVKYRVLDPNSTAFGAKDPESGAPVSNTMFLDCDTILRTMVFDGGSKVWQGSEIRSWLNGDDFLNSTDCFSVIENKAIVKSNKTLSGRTLCYKDDFDLDNIGLTDDRIFLLDITEATNSAYGYKSHTRADRNRVKIGGYSYWWLRSPYCGPENGVCDITPDGEPDYYLAWDDEDGVSPAFNVGLSSVIFTSLISGTAGAAGAEYKLTLKDEQMNAAVQNGKSVNMDGNLVTIPFTISNYIDSTDSTKSRKANRVSVLITDKAWTESDASVLQYGELTTDLDFLNAGATASDIGSFSIDTNKVTGTCGTDYYIYILAENSNSWDTEAGKRTTDYASIPVELNDINQSHELTNSQAGSIFTDGNDKGGFGVGSLVLTGGIALVVGCILGMLIMYFSRRKKISVTENNEQDQ